jgi:hypothetical protein
MTELFTLAPSKIMRISDLPRIDMIGKEISGCPADKMSGQHL